MKKRNQIIAAFLAATMIITPATSIFAKAAKDGNSSAESYIEEINVTVQDQNEHNDAINCNELYDLQSDPNELNNLYDNPEYADIQTRLQARLDKFRVDQKVDEY